MYELFWQFFSEIPSGLIMKRGSNIIKFSHPGEKKTQFLKTNFKWPYQGGKCAIKFPRVGTTVVLKCSASGNPPPPSVSTLILKLFVWQT